MTPWDLLWSHLLWSGEPRSVTVGSLEWEREFAGGTIAHRIVLDRTEGEISNHCRPSMKSSAMSSEKSNTLLPLGLGGLSRAPVFWAFISTLDSPPTPP